MNTLQLDSATATVRQELDRFRALAVQAKSEVQDAITAAALATRNTRAILAEADRVLGRWWSP